MSGIGEITTLSSFIAVFSIPFLGLLTDYYGRKPFIILTGIAMALGLFITGYTASYILLVVAYALIRFAFLGGQPARGAMTAESVSKETIGEAFGIVTSSFFIARVFMPSISGILADSIGYDPTFLFGGLIVALGVVFFWIYSVETFHGKREIISWKKLLDALKPKKTLSWLYITTILDRFSWSLWLPLLNAFIGDAYGLSATEVGFLNSIMYSTTLATQYLTGKWIDRIGYLRGLILSESVGALSAITLGITRSIYLLAIGIIATGLSISLWIPSYNKAVSINSEKEYRALEYSKVNAYRAMIAIPAPYIGGYLYDYVNQSLPFAISSILLFLTTGLFYYILRYYSE